jgi:putative transposase
LAILLIGNIGAIFRDGLNLKMERVWRQDYANHEEAMRNINDYIINFYNSQRLHSTLGYVSPNNYEANMGIKQPISVS